MFRERREELADKLVQLREIEKKLHVLYQEPHFEVLKTARIIGCTTTGAAMHAGLLQAVNPGVVIIEEAAEILEAHVLASMPRGIKHLIMIGDHKQLRPKIENYSLSVASGNAHDLNCSMFERLILAGSPHSMLKVCTHASAFFFCAAFTCLLNRCNTGCALKFRSLFGTLILISRTM